MRIFRAKDITVTDYCTGDKRELPSECVVLEFKQEEWAELSEEEVNWLNDCAFVLEYIERIDSLRLYMLMYSQRERWLAFRDLASCNLTLQVARSLIAMIRLKPFAVDGKDAFDLISFLYIELSSAIRRGGKWEYRPEWNYQVRGVPEKWCIGVRVPSELTRLLIGQGGQNIAKVEEYTDYIKNRISFRD